MRILVSDIKELKAVAREFMTAYRTFLAHDETLLYPVMDGKRHFVQGDIERLLPFATRIATVSTNGRYRQKAWKVTVGRIADEYCAEVDPEEGIVYFDMDGMSFWELNMGTGEICDARGRKSLMKI